MSKQDKGGSKPGGCGEYKIKDGDHKVKVTINKEAEFKAALVAKGEYVGREDIPATALWEAFKTFRLDLCRKEIPPSTISRASGRTITAPLAQETKGHRVRPFLIAAQGHPADVEIRQEGLKTMIKIGNGASDQNPIIDRTEILIVRQFPGKLDFSKLPAPYNDSLTRQFARAAALFPGYQTESFRHKALVETPYETADGPLIVTVEIAFDIGAGATIAGQMNDITEFEGEVKAIRKPGCHVNVKNHPEASGMTAEAVKIITDSVLRREREMLLAFSRDFLARNGYADCTLVPVYESKSKPGIRTLQPLLDRGGAEIKSAIETTQRSGFRIFENLKAIVPG